MIDHRAQEGADRVGAFGRDVAERAVDAVGLQARELAHQRLALCGGEKKALAAFKAAYEKIMPNAVFEYSFTNESAAGDFRQEQRWQKIITAATILCLLICSLGLFGLAHLAAQQRVKEIGIRKVLGATVPGITMLLSKDFLKLVAGALVIASPLAALAMNSWLQDCEYRTTIPMWMFAAAGAGTLLITLLTVSVQAIKAAIANPVKSLRIE